MARASCSAPDPPRRCTDTRESDQRSAEQSSSAHSLGSKFSAKSRRASLAWRPAASKSMEPEPGSPLRSLPRTESSRSIRFCVTPTASVSTASSLRQHCSSVKTSKAVVLSPRVSAKTAAGERMLLERSSFLKEDVGLASSASSGRITGVGLTSSAVCSSSASSPCASSVSSASASFFRFSSFSSLPSFSFSSASSFSFFFFSSCSISFLFFSLIASRSFNASFMTSSSSASAGKIEEWLRAYVEAALSGSNSGSSSRSPPKPHSARLSCCKELPDLVRRDVCRARTVR
mmetsp:Transcript_105697/g.187979  ORF Transcript_105697/g.187979 Transcript_105697/m.187979 type:complete len:289 (-) Transcript_105697:1308-2174(-)